MPRVYVHRRVRAPEPRSRPAAIPQKKKEQHNARRPAATTGIMQVLTAKASFAR